MTILSILIVVYFIIGLIFSIIAIIVINEGMFLDGSYTILEKVVIYAIIVCGVSLVWPMVVYCMRKQK